MAIMIFLLTTCVGQPIILYIAAMGNIDTTGWSGACWWCNWVSSFLKIKWAALLPTTLFVLQSSQQLIPFQCFAFNSAWHLWSKFTQQVPWCTTFTKSLPPTEYGYATQLVSSGSHDCYRKLCSILAIWNDVEY